LILGFLINVEEKKMGKVNNEEDDDAIVVDFDFGF
jgi:hypothetical protein